MRIAMAVAAATLIIAFAAHAEDYHPPVNMGLPGCAVSSDFMRRTAYVLGSGPQCCSREIRCTQFLSTNIIRLPRRDKHI
jgi:hypothetical protein